ncbi:MAG TPA: ATP-binding protein [Nitrospira sp.]|nr:ATP-binding protein [Nitrospira sp.]
MRLHWTRLKDVFNRANLFSTEVRHEDTVGREAAEAYDDWRKHFIRERLHVLYYLGFIANPAFIALDYLQHREYLIPLFITRVVLQLGLLCGFLLLKYGPKFIPPNWFVILWVVVANLCVTQMTVILGGFPSQYYNGLNLVYLTAAVIVPVSWPSHLAGQLVTLSSYYVSNFLGVQPNANAAIENSFFLIWTCVALLFSAGLYERLQRAEFRARVSERRARQELEVSNQKLLELDRLKSEFFANISHEIRTPLTLTLGAFQTLSKTKLSGEAGDLVKGGIRNASRLLFLINELLDLAKFDSGRATLRKRYLDFSALVRGVVTNFDSSPNRRIHLKGLTEPVAMEADSRQLKKVLYNLLSNAFKFSDPETGQVWIRLTSQGQSIELEVEDNGIGIPREQLARIFDRFTQVEGGATRRYEGSGIGLALAKEIVTLHGGTIAVESDLGRGSIFTITLPRGNVARDQAFGVPEEEDDQTFLPVRSEEKPEEEPLSPPASKINASLVLVVDDNADMRNYVERILGKEYRIALAKDGAEALEHAQRLRPDLILTDVMMPKMSGHDLLQAVRADKGLRSTPVIFLTARAGTDARIESLDAGADDYLSKPFDELELLARVGNLIRARAQERELVHLQKEKIARFLPPNLADMILSGEHEDFLKGHRREITVVFIDLRGFTAFVEKTAPEEVMTILREYQTVMGRLVSEYGGTLERFVGDAVMVYFNDPLPCPNHAQQAVKMAIAMRQAMNSLQEEWQKQGVQLGAGMGIATGYATIGAVGFEGRLDYAAIGPVTNLAARLCSEAQHGQILVSDRVLPLVKEGITAESMGELTLKGVQRPVAVSQVVSMSA